MRRNLSAFLLATAVGLSLFVSADFVSGQINRNNNMNNQQQITPEQQFRTNFNQANIATKRNMIKSLGNNKNLAKTLMNDLTSYLNNKDLACVAAITVGRLGPEIAGSAIPGLGKVITGEFSEQSKIEAINALGKMRDKAESEIPQLMTCIKNDKETQKVRSTALNQLGKFGVKAKSTLPDLQKLKETDRMIKMFIGPTVAAIERDMRIHGEEVPKKEVEKKEPAKKDEKKADEKKDEKVEKKADEKK